MVYLRLFPNTSRPLSDCITYMAKNKPVNSVPSKQSLMLTKVIKLDSKWPFFGYKENSIDPTKPKCALTIFPEIAEQL